MPRLMIRDAVWFVVLLICLLAVYLEHVNRVAMNGIVDSQFQKNSALTREVAELSKENAELKRLMGVMGVSRP
jgi:hypothetical protein